jgi:hypothetical protein
MEWRRPAGGAPAPVPPSTHQPRRPLLLLLTLTDKVSRGGLSRGGVWQAAPKAPPKPTVVVPSPEPTAPKRKREQASPRTVSAVQAPFYGHFNGDLTETRLQNTANYYETVSGAIVPRFKFHNR